METTAVAELSNGKNDKPWRARRAPCRSPAVARKPPNWDGLSMLALGSCSYVGERETRKATTPRKHACMAEGGKGMGGRFSLAVVERT